MRGIAAVPAIRLRMRQCRLCRNFFLDRLAIGKFRKLVCGVLVQACWLYALADFLQHEFVDIANTLALVWLRRAIGADVGGDLADLLFVHALHGDLGVFGHRDLNVGGNWVFDRMLKAEVERQGLALGGSAVTDAADFQVLFEACFNAFDHVAEQATGQTMQRFRLAAFTGAGDNEDVAIKAGNREAIILSIYEIFTDNLQKMSTCNNVSEIDSIL